MQERHYDSGVKGYIDKPISIDKLNDVLNFVRRRLLSDKRGTAVACYEQERS